MINMNEFYYKGWIVWREGYGWYAQNGSYNPQSEICANTLEEIEELIDKKENMRITERSF